MPAPRLLQESILKDDKKVAAPSTTPSGKIKDPQSASSSEASSETDKSHASKDKIKASEDAGADTEKLRRRYLLRRFWQTASGFWGGSRNRLAWILSAALLLIILFNIAASYGMNLWNRAIFDALERKESENVLRLSMIYFAILAVS